MAKWVATYETFTPTTLSNATAFTDNGHWSIAGQTATQRYDIYEVYLVGQSTVSGNMNSCVLARNGVTGGPTGLTALSSIQSQGPLDPASAAITSAPLAFSASSTKPQRTAATGQAKLALGFNPFGGVARWWVPQGSGAEFRLLGTTSLGECSITATTVGVPGAMMASIQYDIL